MSILSSAIRAAARKLFPEITLSPLADFFPMERLDRGEFSSSAALELARLTKQGSEHIAAQLIAEVSATVSASLRCDSGYVVSVSTPRDLVLSEIVPDVVSALGAIGVDRRIGDARAVRCILPDSTEPVYARVRLLARVMQQVLFVVAYEGGCDVFVDPLPPRQLRSQHEVIDFFRLSVFYALEHESERRLEMSGSHDTPSNCRVCVWTTHHYHERLPRVRRVELSEARKRGVIDVRMPNDAWLLSRDRALSGLLERGSLERVVAMLQSDEAWLRFLFHGASTVLSGDFDPAVALFDEFASPLYSARLLVERYQRFEPYAGLPVAADRVARTLQTMGLERRLALRGLAMPVVTARALALGEVAEWAGAFEEFSSRAHIFINTPQIRGALERGEVSGEVGEIVASLGFGLSSILRFVAEGPCEDR